LSVAVSKGKFSKKHYTFKTTFMKTSKPQFVIYGLAIGLAAGITLAIFSGEYYMAHIGMGIGAAIGGVLHYRFTTQKSK
jgi:hypothetical protein